MPVHPAQDVREAANRLLRVGSLVEHDALGALAHRRVGDLGPGRHAALGHRLENLRGPDHRHVGRLAQPQQLLLHLREALEAQLDAQVAARDHHRGRAAPQGVDDERGQRAHRQARLHLEHQRGRRPLAQRGDGVVQCVDLFGALHEREADGVGDAERVGEGGEVLGGRHRQVDLGLGEVDALLQPQPLALAADVLDHDTGRRADGRALGLGDRQLDDVAADLPVVEPHLLADPHLLEDGRQRDLDARHRIHRPRPAARRHQPEGVPHLLARLGDAGGDAHLGAREVDLDGDMPPEIGRRGPHVGRHRNPVVRRVVGGVDAHGVSAGGHQPPRDVGVLGGARRQGGQHAHPAVERRRAEDPARAQLDQAITSAQNLGGRWQRPVAAASQRRQRRPDRVELRADPGLGAPERRQAEEDEILLQVVEIVATQRQVANQVGRARAHLRVGPGQGPAGERRAHLALDVLAQCQHPVEQGGWIRASGHGPSWGNLEFPLVARLRQDGVRPAHRRARAGAAADAVGAAADTAAAVLVRGPASRNARASVVACTRCGTR